MIRFGANFLLVAYALFLLAMTHLPVQPEVLFPTVWDKTLHLLAYGGLGAFAAVRLIAYQATAPAWWTWWGALAIAGIVDELTQPFVGRTCDLTDWIADLLGLSAALLVLAVASRLFLRGPQPSPGSVAG